MQGVILAGGLNERLWPIGVPAGAKPLPLIAPLVNNMSGRCEQTVVVCSPTNVGAIAEMVTPKVRLVVQPSALGAGDALLRGLEATDGQGAIVACADNVIPPKAWTIFMNADRHNFAFGAAAVEESEAARFARFRNNQFFEGPMLDRPLTNKYVVWLGPLYVHSASLLVSMLAKLGPMYRTLGIVPALNDYARSYSATPVFLDPHVKDVGTPEEWIKFTGEDCA